MLPPLCPVPGRPADAIWRIAHRGWAGAERYAPADLAAVRAAGGHLVEFDVHVAPDGELVVRHDGPADGAPPVRGVIAAAREAGLGLYADIKTLTEPAAGVLALLLADEGMADRTVLASTDVEVLAYCARVAPGVPRAVLFRAAPGDPVPLARVAGAQYVHPCWERLAHPDQVLAESWLDEVRTAGLGVVCWHEERPEVLDRLCRLGVDAICTDDVPLLTRIATAAAAAPLP